MYLGVTYFGATKPLFVSGGAQQSNFTNASDHALKGVGSLEYNEDILPHLIIQGNEIFISRLYQNKWILQQDNAPSYTASMNRAILNHRLPGRWCEDSEDWPPHSLDLSWIENGWAWADRKLNAVREQIKNDSDPVARLRKEITDVLGRLPKV